MCDFLSSDSINFIMSEELLRFEKTKALADYKIAQKYLDVCFQFNNCGKCLKCLRTLVTLDILNALDNFRECFDIDSFKHNRVDAYFWLLRTADKNSLEDNAIYATDLLERAKKQKVIPVKSYVLYYISKPIYTLSHILRKNRRLSNLVNAIKKHI